MNLAAVDEDFAAELEKVAGPTQWARRGWNWMRNRLGARPTPGPGPTMGPPRPTPGNQNMADRRAMAHAGAWDALKSNIQGKLSGLGGAIDTKVQNAFGGVGNFLRNSITGGQFRQGLNTYKKGLGQVGGPGAAPLNQSQVNAGLSQMAAGAAKTGLLYGGLGYGGYRALRSDPNSQPEVARMYHQAMPY